MKNFNEKYVQVNTNHAYTTLFNRLFSNTILYNFAYGLGDVITEICHNSNAAIWVQLQKIQVSHPAYRNRTIKQNN